MASYFLVVKGDGTFIYIFPPCLVANGVPRPPFSITMDSAFVLYKKGLIFFWVIWNLGMNHF